MQGTIVDEIDHYVTFRTWATEKIVMGECKHLKEAENAWVLELMKPENKVIERRGRSSWGTSTGSRARIGTPSSLRLG